MVALSVVALVVAVVVVVVVVVVVGVAVVVMVVATAVVSSGSSDRSGRSYTLRLLLTIVPVPQKPSRENTPSGKLSNSVRLQSSARFEAPNA